MTLLDPQDSRSDRESVTRDGWPRYLLFLNGKWRWRPTRQMRNRGFGLVNFGAELTDDVLAKATTLNKEWDLCRKGAREQRPNVLQGESVYVVGFDRYIKIGYTTDLRTRIEDLECRLPERLTVHATFPGSRKIEAAFHGKYAEFRLRGEWFKNEGKLALWIKAGCPFNGKVWSKIVRAE